MEGNFLFVDNVKAGSTSVRDKLRSAFWISWLRSDMPFNVSGPAGGCVNRVWKRTSSMSFAPEDLAPLLRFSIVRDPVEKFESGVREAWAANESLRNLTADEMLDRQLELEQDLRKPGQSCAGNWLNEHLQSSSWRLSARTSDSKLIDYDLIAKVESFGEDWHAIVAAMSNISAEARRRLMAIGHANNRTHEDRSKLSPEGIRRMCRSSVYGSEWECFGYPRPTVCD